MKIGELIIFNSKLTGRNRKSPDFFNQTHKIKRDCEVTPFGQFTVDQFVAIANRYIYKYILSRQFVLLSDKPGKPKVTLKETDIQTSYIKLTWTSPVDNGGNPVLDYRVIVSGAANQTLEGVVCTEKLIEKLTPGKSYTVTLSVRNSVGYGESDSRSFTTKSKGKGNFEVAFPCNMPSYALKNKGILIQAAHFVYLPSNIFSTVIRTL